MKSKRELTFTAILIGIFISVFFGAANAYLGLRAGLTVSASIPAAVISMGVLRFLLRRDSILENNMVQTIGSAGESLVAGAAGMVSAIIVRGYRRVELFSRLGLSRVRGFAGFCLRFLL
jgi:putative OPT family oligopeptide transporter